MSSTVAQPTATPTVVIEPTRGWGALHLSDIWAYRELLYFLIWRDVKVRYKQTVLGAAWAVLQPVVTMVVFTIFFGNLARVPSEGVPYPIFSYAALLPWNLFAQGLNQSANSLVGSANLIRKVYFPRLVIPIASVLTRLVDFAIAFAVLVALMVGYRIPVTAGVLLLPILVLLAYLAALGGGLWLSALNVQYRDVGWVVPFFTQIWLFVTPVIYPSRMVTEWLVQHGLPGWLYALNPMVGVVEGFRWSLLGIGQPPARLLAVGAAVTATLVTSGLVYFRRMERTFADVV